MSAQPPAPSPPPVASPHLLAKDILAEDLLAEAPRGALALAGIAVGLLVLAWLATYFLAFLPRGPVG